MSIIIKTELKTYNVKKMCDCGGEIRFTGSSFSNGSGIYYDHMCSNCHIGETIKGEYYPRKEYEECQSS